MSKFQRRKSYCDPKVQGALVRRFLLHWLLFVFSAFTLLVVWQVLVSGDPIGGFRQAFQEVMVRNLPVFVVLVLLLPVFIKDTITLSNRFAGPIVRLRESLRDWADGNPVRPINLRDGDFWQELADLFNRAVEKNQTEIVADDQVSQQTVGELEEVGA